MLHECATVRDCIGNARTLVMAVHDRLSESAHESALDLEAVDAILERASMLLGDTPSLPAEVSFVAANLAHLSPEQFALRPQGRQMLWRMRAERVLRQLALMRKG